MMMGQSSLAKKEAAIISERAFQNFEHHQHVWYRLLVVNDQYNQQYNFFLEWHYRGERCRSVPLHVVQHYELHYLKQVLINVQNRIGFSILLRNFPIIQRTLLQKS